MSKTHYHSSGIGFCSLLAILFIALKLLDKINWSWWWVLSPIWIPICIVLLIIAIILIVIFLYKLFKILKWR